MSLFFRSCRLNYWFKGTKIRTSMIYQLVSMPTTCKQVMMMMMMMVSHIILQRAKDVKRKLTDFVSFLHFFFFQTFDFLKVFRNDET